MTGIIDQMPGPVVVSEPLFVTLPTSPRLRPESLPSTTGDGGEASLAGTGWP